MKRREALIAIPVFFAGLSGCSYNRSSQDSYDLKPIAKTILDPLHQESAMRYLIEHLRETSQRICYQEEYMKTHITKEGEKREFTALRESTITTGCPIYDNKGRKVILTANHIISPDPDGLNSEKKLDADRNPYIEVTRKTGKDILSVYSRKDLKLIDTEIILSNKEEDILVLETKEPFESQLCNDWAKEDRFYQGLEVVICGYPNGSDRTIDIARITSKEYKKYDGRSIIPGTFEVSASVVRQGHSGSIPHVLYQENENILKHYAIGMSARVTLELLPHTTYATASGTGVVISSTKIFEVLEKNNLKYLVEAMQRNS